MIGPGEPAEVHGRYRLRFRAAASDLWTTEDELSLLSAINRVRQLVAVGCECRLDRWIRGAPITIETFAARPTSSQNAHG